MKKVITLLTLLCVSTVLTACGIKDDIPQETATNVTVFEVSNSNIDSKIKFTGEIKAKEEGVVTPKSAGIIKSVNCDIGDYVNAGDVLAILDDTDYRLAYNQALAAYNNALASYNSVTNGSMKMNKNQLEAAVSSAQIEYNNATDNYNRQKALYDAGGISKVTLETAETRLKNAEINLNSAKKSYDITINEVNIDSEKSAKAAVESAKAALDSASNSLENTVITAPISGYIATRNATIGQMASQGSPIFVIKDTEVVNAEVSVTESVIPYITADTEAIISVDSAGITDIICTVSEVSGIKNDSTGMYTVRVMIENEDNKLKVGMLADVTLKTVSVDNAIVIPSDSIMQLEDEHYVYIVNDNIAQKRVIKTGITNNDFTEVKNGLKKGDYVVVSGKEYLSETNNKVNIVEE